jgi:hypothetical protein
MNTKTFAQQSRALLMEGVANKLLYWGFKSDGTTSEEPNPVAGGYTFRGKVFDDESVPKLWKSLHQAINKKGIDVVKEEAAYTWFNRIMALQIMAKNDYLDAQLAYVPGMANTPQILQKARQGQYSFLNSKEQERLKRIITDFSKEQEAFALLFVGYCHSNKMLNNVFGKLDDYTELLLPDNMLQDSGFLHLLNTTDAISDEQYKEVELIGWLYQFYISERKDEVFASFKKKKKAEAKDIPAATQIFTPNWIVKYMVQNTVGKIWLDKNPNSKIKSSLKYLVENDTSTELSASSDSTTETIISDVSQLTLIDPAAGSGHILVEGFDLLYQMYMEEYYTPEEAVESILKNNLFGLDLDDRAAQLATFAILLKAAKQYHDVFAKGWLPNVYAMPEYATFSDQEIKDFLGSEGTPHENELAVALQLMEQAKNLGSVMKLSLSNEAGTYIENRFTALKNTDFRDLNTEIVYQKIKSFVPVLLILSKKYSSVVANPPYMHRKNMPPILKEYVFKYYPKLCTDLFAVFTETQFELSIDRGYIAAINQQSWMFISSYEDLRSDLIKNTKIDSLIHLGLHVFKELNSKIVQSVSYVVKKEPGSQNEGVFIDVRSGLNVDEKMELFLNNPKTYIQNQSDFLKIPGQTIAYWIESTGYKIFENKNISDYSTIFQGMITGDNDHFVKSWFELNQNFINRNITQYDKNAYKLKYWVGYSKGGESVKWYGNQEHVVNFKEDGLNFTRGKNQYSQFYFQEYITWSYISLSLVSRYFPMGFVWDVAGSGLFPNDKNHLKLITSLLSSKVGNYILGILNPTLNYQVENIAAVPIIIPGSDVLARINGYADKCIELTEKIYNSYEISWLFNFNSFSLNEKSLKAACTEKINNITEDFFLIHANEEALSQIFIDLYDLNNELSNSISISDITAFGNELKKAKLIELDSIFRSGGSKSIQLPIDSAELISQFISYGIGLFMGRYRLDKPGLNIAHPNPSKEELASYMFNHGEVIIDQDAILPIMGRNCNFNDDVVKQFTQLLDTIWGHEQRTENINFIQECLDKELEKFLVNDFWSYHCSMYKKTPIYWLFSSKKGAFQVLVYMHRMNEFTVEKIRANYLLEHLKYLKSEITQQEANASSLSTGEAKQLDKLRADLIECEQYDMALKNVADQQIKFDLDDGVAKNFELFETVVAKIK